MREQSRLGLSGFSLKLIALASMTVDHIGVVLFEHLKWMRMVGRLAFPIYAFLLVEGFVHTHHRRRYCLRLGLFALLSEWPFDLAVFGGVDMRGQNVFFTLLLGVLMLWGCERFSGDRVLRFLPLLAPVAAVLLRCDYDAGGLLLIWMFWVSRGDAHAVSLPIGIFCGSYLLLALFAPQGTPIEQTALLRGAGIELCALAAIWPLGCYNGRRGGERLPAWPVNLLLYAYYPLHLLLITAVILP